MPLEYVFGLYLSVHCGDFIEQIKKICHIQFIKSPLAEKGLFMAKVIQNTTTEKKLSYFLLEP